MKKREHVLALIPEGGVCAEIGVWRGAFARQMLSRRPAELHLIDPWRYVPEYPDAWYGGRIGSQRRMDVRYLEVLLRLGTRRGVGVHRMSSVEAAELFPDGFFDFVYIDGDHTYRAVKADLEAWWPKIRTGGVLAGDDYGTPGWWDDGVTRAVDEFSEEATVKDGQWIIRQNSSP